MVDYPALQLRARDDIHCAIGIWADIIKERLGTRLEYAYTKGSSMKPWDSIIDYVPVVSDVDIHLRLPDGEKLLSEDDPVSDALAYSTEYETRFLVQRPDHLHLPRMQVILLNDLEALPGYIPPAPQDVHPLSGVVPGLHKPSTGEVRSGDIAGLLEFKAFLDAIPMWVIDRAGFDFWTLIRSMSWRVAPSPVRLLTQDHPEPLEVWTWNRTRISQELRAKGYTGIADAYHDFYSKGWQLFLSGFTGLPAFRAMFMAGYRVLKDCYDFAASLPRPD
jgi:hypothetical protein